MFIVNNSLEKDSIKLRHLHMLDTKEGLLFSAIDPICSLIRKLA